MRAIVLVLNFKIVKYQLLVYTFSIFKFLKVLVCYYRVIFYTLINLPLLLDLAVDHFVDIGLQLI